MIDQIRVLMGVTGVVMICRHGVVVVIRFYKVLIAERGVRTVKEETPV